jgi:hypothetical protein
MMGTFRFPSSPVVVDRHQPRWDPISRQAPRGASRVALRQHGLSFGGVHDEKKQPHDFRVGDSRRVIKIEIAQELPQKRPPQSLGIGPGCGQVPIWHRTCVGMSLGNRWSTVSHPWPR